MFRSLVMGRKKVSEAVDGRVVSYVFSMFGWTDVHQAELRLLPQPRGRKGVRFIHWGREICPTTLKPHLQGWIHYWDKVPLSRAKKDLFWLTLGTHIEPRFGNKASNLVYCSKDRDFEEHGSEPTVEPLDVDRMKLKECALQVSEGTLTPDQIQVQSPEVYARYHRGLEAIVTSRERVRPRTSMPIVIWNWGKSGCGKSHWAEWLGQQLGSLYQKPEEAWWTGYKGQALVQFEELCPEIDDSAKRRQFKTLLKWFDRYQMLVKVHYGMSELNSKVFVVTSSEPPSHFVPHGQDEYQLIRRLRYVIEFRARDHCIGHPISNDPEEVFATILEEINA